MAIRVHNRPYEIRVLHGVHYVNGERCEYLTDADEGLITVSFSHDPERLAAALAAAVADAWRQELRRLVVPVVDLPGEPLRP